MLEKRMRVPSLPALAVAVVVLSACPSPNGRPPPATTDRADGGALPVDGDAGRTPPEQEEPDHPPDVGPIPGQEGEGEAPVGEGEGEAPAGEGEGEPDPDDA